MAQLREATALPGTAPSRRTAPSLVRRTFLALEALAEQPLTAAEIGRLLSVDRSSALRLMTALETTGYVSRDAVSKRYANVPARFYGLIASHDDHADWSEIVDPVLSEMRDEFGEAAIMGVPANGTMVYLAFFPSVHIVAVRERLGTTRPMHCSALGKAYLAALSPSELDAEMALLTFRGGTNLAARTPAELRGRLDATRAGGYATDRNETFEGGTCVAAPVWIGATLIGALGLSGPSGRFTDDRIRAMGERLTAVTRRLGGPIG